MLLQTFTRIVKYRYKNKGYLTFWLNSPYNI